MEDESSWRVLDHHCLLINVVAWLSSDAPHFSTSCLTHAPFFSLSSAVNIWVIAPIVFPVVNVSSNFPSSINSKLAYSFPFYYINFFYLFIFFTSFFFKIAQCHPYSPSTTIGKDDLESSICTLKHYLQGRSIFTHYIVLSHIKCSSLLVNELDNIPQHVPALFIS